VNAVNKPAKVNPNTVALIQPRRLFIITPCFSELFSRDILPCGARQNKPKKFRKLKFYIKLFYFGKSEVAPIFFTDFDNTLLYFCTRKSECFEGRSIFYREVG